MRRKALNRRPDFTVTRVIRPVMRPKRFSRYAFQSERRATNPQNAADCLRFAATSLKFAARFRKVRQSAGHAL
jgi:hypothetical protein